MRCDVHVWEFLDRALAEAAQRSTTTCPTKFNRTQMKSTQLLYSKS